MPGVHVTIFEGNQAATIHLLGNEVDVGFLQLVLAIALGFAIPLMIFGMWLSSQLDMYLGRAFDQDLAQDADQDSDAE